MLLVKMLLVGGMMSAAESKRLASCEVDNANVTGIWTFNYKGNTYDRRKYVSLVMAEFAKSENTLSGITETPKLVSAIEELERNIEQADEREFAEVWLEIYKRRLRSLNPYVAEEMDLKKRAQQIASSNPGKAQALKKEIQETKDRLEQDRIEIFRQVEELEAERKKTGAVQKEGERRIRQTYVCIAAHLGGQKKNEQQKDLGQREIVKLSPSLRLRRYCVRRGL